MKYKKIKRKITPSGLWDDGLYYISDEILEIPDHLGKDVIREDLECKGIVGKQIRLTLGNKQWIVCNPAEKKDARTRKVS